MKMKTINLNAEHFYDLMGFYTTIYGMMKFYSFVVKNPLFSLKTVISNGFLGFRF